MGEMRGKCWTPAKKTPHRTTHKPRTTLVVPNRPPGHSCPAQTNVIRERKAEIQRMKNSNVFHHWGRPGITPRTKTVASACHYPRNQVGPRNACLVYVLPATAIQA